MKVAWRRLVVKRRQEKGSVESLGLDWRMVKNPQDL